MHFVLVFNALMVWGLLLIPAGVWLMFITGWIFQSWEIGALMPMAISLAGCWAAAVVLILLGIGQQIH